MKLNGMHQLQIYAADMSLMGDKDTTKKNTGTLTDTSDAGLQVYTEKTKYTLWSHHQRQLRDSLKLCHSSNIWE
jgi:hypothetical protein